MDIKRILFIVSDPVDVILTQMVFRDSKVRNELSIVSSGDQALRFIRKEAPYDHEQTPDLIIVDLNASVTEGWDFIRDVKGDDEFKRIPVLVFVFNMSDEEIAHLYDLNVNCCMRKPLDLEEFTQVVESIEMFWLKAVNFQQNNFRKSRKF